MENQTKHIWSSPNPHSGWRKHNANISKEE